MNQFFRFLLLFLLNYALIAQNATDWTHRVRIAGHSLTADQLESIIQSVQETNVFGIEVDNDITGRYDSFLDPADKLADITKMANAAHAIGNYAFVYIAGLECITSDADERESTLFKDHPDWVQRDREGRPAIFGGGTAFWITEGDEDVWISPYAKEWRQLYMQRVREIAATGIDGIYVDIPYWMTHFEGWEKTWASFDAYTVKAFRQRTGHDALEDMDIGDFSDPVFKKWIDFRIDTIVEFMDEINSEVKGINPECKVIAEIYPGIDESAVRVGADIFALYPVVDVICHEFSEGAYMAASRTPVDWLRYMAGMFTFRAFAGKKPTWMLSYSWNGHERIKPGNAMQNLFVAQAMAGANSWDARGEVMSGTNDSGTRRGVFDWIEANQELLYGLREPVAPVGVYFSVRSRNYFPDDVYKSYMGLLLYLMQEHLEFQIVTERTWSSFSGNQLILPGVREFDGNEIEGFEQYLSAGKKIYWSGIDELDEDEIPTALPMSENLTAVDDAVFADYYDEFMENHDHVIDPKITESISEWIQKPEGFNIDAPPFVVSQICKISGKTVVFLANFTGLMPDEVSDPILQHKIKIILPAASATKAYLIPFMQERQALDLENENGYTVCIVPWLLRGAIVTFE